MTLLGLGLAFFDRCPSIRKILFTYSSSGQSEVELPMTTLTMCFPEKVLEGPLVITKADCHFTYWIKFPFLTCYSKVFQRPTFVNFMSMILMIVAPFTLRSFFKRGFQLFRWGKERFVFYLFQNNWEGFDQWCILLLPWKEPLSYPTDLSLLLSESRAPQVEVSSLFFPLFYFYLPNDIMLEGLRLSKYALGLFYILPPKSEALYWGYL